MTGMNDERLGILAEMLDELEKAQAAARTARRGVSKAIGAMGQPEFLLEGLQRREDIIKAISYDHWLRVQELDCTVHQYYRDLVQCHRMLGHLLDDLYPDIEKCLKAKQQKFLDEEEGRE